MLNVIAQRLVLSIPVLFGVLLFGFLLMQVIPGDPALVVAGPSATPDVVEAIRQEMGLDRPVLVQFWAYLERMAQGDLGRSMISNKAVTEELGAALGPTLELMVGAMIWSVPVGIAMGTLAAVLRGSMVDRAIMALSVAGVSLPIFFISLVLIQWLGVTYPMFTFIGRPGPWYTPEGFNGLFLPALSLGLILIGPVARMTRSSVLEVLKLDHVRTARAKGLSETRVILAHGLRNALIPVITLVGLQIGYLLGGAVVTETIFAWPGVGKLIIDSINMLDRPVVVAYILVIVTMFILINLIVDVLYSLLDPRIRSRA